MLVKFVKDHGGFEAGDVVDLAPVFVELLLEQGVAEVVEEKKAKPKAEKE